MVSRNVKRARRVEPVVAGADLGVAAQQEQRAGTEHTGQGDLSDHQERAEAARVLPGGDALQRLRRVDAAGGQQPGNHHGGQGDDRREERASLR